MRNFGLFVIALLLGDASSVQAETTFLKTNFRYQLGPADNPLSGLVPYRTAPRKDFPHSLEFVGMPFSDVVTGPGQYDFGLLESRLEDVRSRGNQAVVRFYADWPDRTGVMPRYWRDAGLFTGWTNEATGQSNVTPTWDDGIVRSEIVGLIEAFGRRYDGDVRIAYLEAGMIGSWGEWHNWPREADLWASKETQRIILDALANSVRVIPTVLRYPYADGNDLYADNTIYPLGYHDDSFAWATMPDPRPGREWYFGSLLADAGATRRWRTFPIGGEIRPEVWGRWASDPPGTPDGQDFATCRDAMHVIYLREAGLFRDRDGEDNTAAYRQRAQMMVRKMGYDFFINDASMSGDVLSVSVENRGITPFYDERWKPLILVGGPNGRRRYEPNWRLTKLMPGKSRTWTMRMPDVNRPPGDVTIQFRNVMEGGKPLRFANAWQRRGGVLRIGRFEAAP